MADLIQMLIEVLRIDCNVVQCYYTNQIDAIFNLFFFPTVFILLIIYLILQYVLDEVRGGLRLLISIALYAVIVINGLMTLFIPLSQFWWIILILIVGAWVFFFRLLFKEKRGGKGNLAGSAAMGGIAGYLAGRARETLSDDYNDMKKAINDRLINLRGIVEKIEKAPAGADIGALTAAYWNMKTETEELIKAFARSGKIQTGVADFDVEKRGKQYWRSIEEISKKFEKAERHKRAA